MVVAAAVRSHKCPYTHTCSFTFSSHKRKMECWFGVKECSICVRSSPNTSNWYIYEWKYDKMRHHTNGKNTCIWKRKTNNEFNMIKIPPIHNYRCIDQFQLRNFSDRQSFFRFLFFFFWQRWKWMMSCDVSCAQNFNSSINGKTFECAQTIIFLKGNDWKHFITRI